MAVVVVDNADFGWVSGEELIETWRKPGHDWQKWFCRRCGSPLPGVNDRARMFVPAGLLEEGHGLAVTDHIWVSSKASWDVPGDEGRVHLEAYDGGGA